MDLAGKHDVGAMIFEARAKWLPKAVEPTASATPYPFSGLRRLFALRAARAPAGLERGGDRSAGPAGGRAARGERSEPP
ncbi:hypothetical protein GCM10023347_05300 [Streptomyces chumphonensis]